MQPGKFCAAAYGRIDVSGAVKDDDLPMRLVPDRRIETSREAIRLLLEHILPTGKESDCDGNAEEDAPGRRRDEVQHVRLVSLCDVFDHKLPPVELNGLPGPCSFVSLTKNRK